MGSGNAPHFLKDNKMTYDEIQNEIESEMKSMDIAANDWPSRSGFLRVSLIVERRDHIRTRRNLSRQIADLKARIEENEN
jgi:hypothetical protein